MEGPRVIDVLSDLVVTLDLAVQCTDAYAVLRREKAQGAVAVNCHGSAVGVLLNPAHVESTPFADRHLTPGHSVPTHQLPEGPVTTDSPSHPRLVSDHIHHSDLTLPCDTLLVEAAATMMDNRLQWLPVTCHGEVVGLLAAMDIVRWVAESCGALPPVEAHLSYARSLDSDAPPCNPAHADNNALRKPRSEDALDSAV